MKVVLYDNKYKTELSCLLCDYFKETLKDDYEGSLEKASSMIDYILTNNMFIYLVEDKDEVLGFVSLYKHSLYGMSKEVLVVDHMYVIPKARSGRAILWLYATIGKCMDNYGINGVGTTYIDSANKNNNRYVKGKVIAEITTVNLEDVQGIYKRYMKELRAV